MGKKFLFFSIAIVALALSSGCAVRVTPLSEGAGWVETDVDVRNDTTTVTTKGPDGKVVKEVTTTRNSNRKRVKTRPYRWQDRGYYDGYGYYR